MRESYADKVAKILPYVLRRGPQVHVTEDYVSSPPAATITDEQGFVFALGLNTAPRWQSPTGQFAFDVLRNGFPTGETASVIERSNGRVRIFVKSKGGFGWKYWNARQFV